METYSQDPIFLNIYLTNRCNLSCKHCIDNSWVLSDEEIRKELSDEEIFWLIDYYGERWLMNISFSWWEPLLHKNVFEFVKYARNKDINWTLQTDKYIQWIVDSWVNFLRSSLEWNLESTHDAIRWDWNFKKVLAFLEKLVNAGVPKVGVSFVVRKDNLNEIEPLIERLIEMKINSITIAPLMPSWRWFYLEWQFLSKEEYKKLVFNVIKLKEKYKWKIDIIFDCPLEAIAYEWNPDKLNNFTPCIIWRFFLWIKADGWIYACPMRDNVIIWNIRNDDLDNIWHNSDFLKNIRNTDLLKWKCAKCSVKKHCWWWCKAFTDLITSSPLNPDPYCWK